MSCSPSSPTSPTACSTSCLGAGRRFAPRRRLVAAWRADTGGLTAAGGSSPGGPDHLATHLLAQSVGLDPRAVHYLAFDGGGDLLAALLGGRAAFGVSSPAEFSDQLEAGQLRVLAVTSATRVPGIDAPTLREAGVDLVFANWRGLVAPPGIGDAERRALIALVDGAHRSPQWQQVLAQIAVTDSYLTGDAFHAFLQQENDRVSDILQQLGLAVV